MANVDAEVDRKESMLATVNQYFVRADAGRQKIRVDGGLTKAL
jgi:hypothetical protein